MEMSDQPFFIVGSQRSGTTLLQTYLDAHPDICIPPESHIFEHFAGTYHSYGDLSDSANLLRFIRELLNDATLRCWRLDVSAEDLAMQCQRRDVPGVIDCLFQWYAKREGKTRWGDKTPAHTLYLEDIHHFFPGARYIHLIRDGRDVAESLSRVYFGPNTVDRIALLWQRYILAFQAFKKKIGPEQFLEIRFEDFLKDPEAIMQRICRFLEISEITFNQAVPQTQRRKDYVASDSIHGALSHQPDTSKIGVYQKKLSMRQIEIFEAVAGSELKLYEYALQMENPRGPTGIEKVRFFVTNYFLSLVRRVGKWQHLREVLQYKLRRMSKACPFKKT